MSTKNKPLSRKDDIVVQELDGEVLIYDLRTNRAFCLNETSALVWQACDGSKDVSQLSEFIGKHLNSKVNEDLVWLALDQLKKENLLTNKDDYQSGFGGMSRREVIKKVGLGTAIALPVVLSLVAPKAIHANSACVPVTSGCVCSNPTSGSRPAGTPCTTTTPCTSANCVCVQGPTNGSTTGNCVP